MRDKLIYMLLVELFKVTGISPAEAIPVMRQLADDAERKMQEPEFQALRNLDSVPMVH